MKTSKKFALCIANAGHESSLILGKVYRILPDRAAAKDALIRVIDESGEDYLHDKDCFVLVDFPRSVERKIRALQSAAALVNRLALPGGQQETRWRTVNAVKIEVERETDGRWIGEVPELPGVMAYGATRDEAISRVQALALRVLADRLEHGERFLKSVRCSRSRHEPVGLG